MVKEGKKIEKGLQKQTKKDQKKREKTTAKSLLHVLPGIISHAGMINLSLIPVKSRSVSSDCLRRGSKTFSLSQKPGGKAGGGMLPAHSCKAQLSS